MMLVTAKIAHTTTTTTSASIWLVGPLLRGSTGGAQPMGIDGLHHDRGAPQTAVLRGAGYPE